MKIIINKLLWVMLWAFLPAAMAMESPPSRDESERLRSEGFRKVAGRGMRTVNVPNDHVAAITKELAGEPFLDALAKVLPIDRSRLDVLEFRGFGNSTATFQFVDEEIWGNFPTKLPESARKIGDRVERYVKTRWEGHTPEYALESLLEPARSKTRPPSPRASILWANSDIPAVRLVAVTNNVEIVQVPADRLYRPGVVARPGEMVDLTVTNHSFKVIDGPLTWHYVSRGNGTSWTERETDSQEDDPEKAEAFRQTRLEVQALIEARGSKGFGTLFHDAEMARILREKHGIEWKSSGQLWPWIYQ